MTKRELSEKTKEELMSMAGKAEIPGRSRMNKDDLVEALAKVLKTVVPKGKKSAAKKAGEVPSQKKAAPKPAEKKKSIPKKTAAIKSVSRKTSETRKASTAKEKEPKKATGAKLAAPAKKTLVEKAVAVPVKVAKPTPRAAVQVRKEGLLKAPPPAAKTATLQEKVEDTRFYLGSTERPSVAREKLPVGYGENRVVLMVRDPHWAYTYWEVTGGRVDDARRMLGKSFNASRLTLRVYDITGVEFVGTNAHSFYDIEVHNLLGNRYISLGTANRTYCIEIGYRTAGGSFFPLIRSNRISSPRNTVAPPEPFEEAAVSEEIYRSLYKGEERSGSAELAEVMKIGFEKGVSSGDIRGVRPAKPFRKS